MRVFIEWTQYNLTHLMTSEYKASYLSLASINKYLWMWTRFLQETPNYLKLNTQTDGNFGIGRYTFIQNAQFEKLKNCVNFTLPADNCWRPDMHHWLLDCCLVLCSSWMIVAITWQSIPTCQCGPAESMWMRSMWSSCTSRVLILCDSK